MPAMKERLRTSEVLGGYVVTTPSAARQAKAWCR